jgi:hypothetical protein
MFNTLISWWQNWRFRRTLGDMEQTLKVLRKMQQDEDELVRVMAALSILRLDPTKSNELIPLIQAARGSENRAVSDLVTDFFAANWRHSAA